MTYLIEANTISIHDNMSYMEERTQSTKVNHLP
jgi:hypothetical protein